MQCSDLVAESNMQLSQKYTWVDDVDVQVSCDAGYVLDVGTLTKNISCILVNGDPKWNSSVGQCTSKYL